MALKGQKSRVLGWKNFEKEVAGHVRTAEPHENIVTLLAAFTHAGRRYLLFPWADGGNLEDLWTKLMPEGREIGPPLPPWCSSDWVWDQCRGLANGLSFIHGFQAPSSPDSPKVVPQLHADIQPTNILCFETRDQRGELSYILKITDFEFSAEFSEPGSTDEIPVSHMVPTYSPPEIWEHEQEDKQKIAQNWDVWCLGCIYLEFLSWFLYGYKEGIVHFARERIDEKHDSGALNVLQSRLEDENYFRIILKRTLSKKLFHSRKTRVGYEIRQRVIEVRYSETGPQVPTQRRVLGFSGSHIA